MIRIFKWLMPLLLMLLFGCQPKESAKLRIATAANMQFAMDELIKYFEIQSGINCEMIISSSGKLTAQIVEGAPYDVFVSANMKYPSQLYKNGFAVDTPQIYAYGKLALWSMKEDVIPSINILTDNKIKHIALANPKMAPYGLATEEVLKHYKIYEAVKDKLVYGENIGQTNQFIISEAAEIGFTAKSVVLSSPTKTKGHWIDLDDSIYTPISQGAVLIKQKGMKYDKAIKFYNFLFSKEAGLILRKYGYSIDNFN